MLLLLDWLAFQPFQVLAADWSVVAQTMVYGAYWLIPILTIIYLFTIATTNFRQRNPRRFSLLSALVMIVYFSKFFMLCFMLLQGLGGFSFQIIDSLAGTNLLAQIPSKLGAVAAALAGLVPMIVMTVGMVRNPYRYKVRRATAVIEGLPKALDGLKIAQISDIHAGTFTAKEPIKKAIEIINDEAADLVFFTGDLVNNTAQEIVPYMDIFDKIKAKYGVFSVLGNHDYGDYVRWQSMEDKQRNLRQLIDNQRLMGWDLLNNENRILEIEGEKVAVIGVENFSGNPRFTKYGDLAKAHLGTDTAALKLLLSHDPSHWKYEVTKDFQDIDIAFAGHTHGGQFGIEIGDWIKWSPVKYAYKEWAGLYQEGRQFLYVNRGFGMLGYPGRVGMPPEITVLEVVAG